MNSIIDLEYFNKHRNKSSPLHDFNGIIYGFWMLGKNFRNTSKYYGAYPVEYLRRIKLLIPEYNNLKVLHLFSGMHTQKPNETTFDIKPELYPDVCGNAVDVASYFENQKFDLIMADPPYDNNHVKYGTKPFSKRKVIRECANITRAGGILIWLDTLLPLYSKEEWLLKGTIGLTTSTNHKVRLITILEKVDDQL